MAVLETGQHSRQGGLIKKLRARFKGSYETDHAIKKFLIIATFYGVTCLIAIWIFIRNLWNIFLIVYYKQIKMQNILTIIYFFVCWKLASTSCLLPKWYKVSQKARNVNKMGGKYNYYGETTQASRWKHRKLH